MKKFIPILSIAFIAMIFTACNQRPKVEGQAVTQSNIGADTAGLASFQMWKAQHELADAQQYNQQTAAVSQPQAPVIIYRDAPAKTVRSTAKSSGSGRPSVSNSGSGNASSTSSGQAQAPVAKKGISKAAKGAIIGGVGGAIAGAVINKQNRAIGAVIGGVIGAGGGYAIGRGMDRKDGRVGAGGGTPPFTIPAGIFQK